MLNNGFEIALFKERTDHKTDHKTDPKNDEERIIELTQQNNKITIKEIAEKINKGLTQVLRKN